MDIIDQLKSLLDSKYVQFFITVGTLGPMLYSVLSKGPSVLTKKVPTWTAIIVVGLFAWLSYSLGAKSAKSYKGGGEELETIKGEVFGRQYLDIAGKRFERCEFEGTTFIISGLGSGEISSSTLSPECRFAFTGPARVALGMITELYQYKEMRPPINKFFDDLKTGRVPVDPGENKSYHRINNIEVSKEDKLNSQRTGYIKI